MSGANPFLAMYREVQNRRPADLTRGDALRLERYEEQCVDRIDELMERIDASTDDAQIADLQDELDDLTVLLGMIRLQAWRYSFPQIPIPQHLIADVYPGFIARFDAQ